MDQRKVKGERKVDVVVFFWTILLAFASGNCRRIADSFRAFGQGAGKTIAISSVYDRWPASLTKLLKCRGYEIGGYSAKLLRDGVSRRLEAVYDFSLQPRPLQRSSSS
jgi:hypothetical protein